MRHVPLRTRPFGEVFEILGQFDPAYSDLLDVCRIKQECKVLTPVSRELLQTTPDHENFHCEIEVKLFVNEAAEPIIYKLGHQIHFNYALKQEVEFCGYFDSSDQFTPSVVSSPFPADAVTETDLLQFYEDLKGLQFYRTDPIIETFSSYLQDNRQLLVDISNGL